MQFQVDSGMVVDVAVYSDSLKPDVIGQIPEQLKDQKYNNQLMADQIGRLHSEDEQEEKMFRDIEGWTGRWNCKKKVAARGLLLMKNG